MKKIIRYYQSLFVIKIFHRYTGDLVTTDNIITMYIRNMRYVYCRKASPLMRYVMFGKKK